MRKALVFLFVLGLLAGCFAHVERWIQEEENSHVELVLDFTAAADYARNSGQPLEQLISEYSAFGVNSLAFSEQKLDDLENRGQAVAFNGMQLMVAMGWLDAPAGAPRPDPAKTYLVVFRPDLLDELRHQLTLALGPGLVRLWPHEVVRIPGWKSPEHPILEIDLPERSLTTLGLGFPQDLVNNWAAKGKSIWLRPENKPQAEPAPVSQALDKFAQLGPGVQGVIFGGAPNEVLGYPQALEATANFLQRQNWKVGVIELPRHTQQKGIETLVRRLPEQAVRVFAVPSAQQEKLKPERVAQMFSLAARERNHRVLYLRPFAYDPSPDKGFENANVVLFQNIQEDLKSRFGAADRFTRKVELLALQATAMGAATAAAWCLFGMELISLPGWLVGVFIVGVAAVSGLSTGLDQVGQQLRTLLALATAMGAVLWAVVGNFDRIEAASRRAWPWQVMLGSLQVWSLMILISLAGGWLASAYLQETSFKLGIDTFRGVKLLTVGVPVLVVLAWFTRPENGAGLLRVFQVDIKLYHLLGLGALALIAILYTLRTGNMAGDVGGEALEYEKYLRVLLDQALGVRPRFKEFLIAHPAMILLPLALWLGGRNIAWVFLLAGTTGMTGLCDTFAHVHTPLLISLIRCLLGAALGAVLGMGFGLIVAPLIAAGKRQLLKRSL